MRWALKDNSMIFGSVIWMSAQDEARLYHLIDEQGREVPHDIKPKKVP